MHFDLILPLIFATVVTIVIATGVLDLRRRNWLNQYRFPAGLQQRLAKRYPAYSRTDWNLVLEGLRDWVHIARMARGRPLSMPSQAVDEAWHEFILFTRQYEEFCRHALGRYLHHVPAEAMRSPRDAQEGIRRAWRLACRLERLDRKAATHVPRIFAIDAQLAFPGGFVYRLHCPPSTQPASDAAGYCVGDIGCASGCGDGGGDGDGGGCGGD